MSDMLSSGNHRLDCSKSSIKSVLIVLLFLCPFNIYSQNDSTQWFPSAELYPLLEYDLLEVQPYSGIFFLESSEIEYDGVYIPVNIGYRKSFIRWNMLAMQFEFAFGAASYTQFEIIKYDQNTLRGGLINTDFKASGYLFAAKGPHKFRLQLFHISSHLGDDYILRNQEYNLNDKSVNYEQIDLIYLYGFQNSDLYIGLGQVISPNAFRKRFMAQAGFQGGFPLRLKKDLSLGLDMKIYEENNFQPDFHAGIGITFIQRDRQQLNVSMDTFYGSLPYSTLDFGRVFWLGPSIKIFL
ncbi:MAG: DUF1207 domain-containing protein [Saprospiraceae bacterium]|nr:DUF1207 domain-containing protein [Saprospiraceae bacterium]